MHRFDGKVALITGAGSGMGRAHALMIAQRGGAVIVNDLKPDGVAETVARIAAAGGRAHGAVCDITDRAAVRAMVAAGAAAHGPVDILINNAGLPSRRLAFEDVDEAALGQQLDVNVKGAFWCMAAVLPEMKARNRGAVVNISSIWGVAGARYASHYGAAKGAVIAFTKHWAREFAPWSIRVNAVAPGSVVTPMGLSSATPDRERELKQRIPLGRAAPPEEISEAVLFLASDAAAFVTGQVLGANGGEVI